MRDANRAILMTRHISPTIDELTADLNGDIVLYGRNQNKHDASLNQTLRRLHESGLIINSTKCEFNKPSIEFFVYTFSADGLAHAPEKVKAL